MSDLNELLKLKAEKKLTSEIDKWLLELRTHKFFSSIEAEVLRDNSYNLRTALWSSSEVLGRKIKEKFLPDYVQKETTDFMEKVETMQNEIDELRNQIS